MSTWGFFGKEGKYSTDWKSESLLPEEFLKRIPGELRRAYGIL
jgi:hypothetical protein